jgi:hypothetical protein
VIDDDETGPEGGIVRWSPVELGVETKLAQAAKSRRVPPWVPGSSRAFFDQKGNEVS